MPAQVFRQFLTETLACDLKALQVEWKHHLRRPMRCVTLRHTLQSGACSPHDLFVCLTKLRTPELLGVHPSPGMLTDKESGN